MYEFIDRAIRVIVTLRGKMHNRLAWLVVLTGCGIVAEPLWLPILYAFLEEKADVKVLFEGSAWFGVLLIFLGLAYHYIREKNERGGLTFPEEDVRKHDSRIFSNFQKLLKFDAFRYELSWIDINHAFLGIECLFSMIRGIFFQFLKMSFCETIWQRLRNLSGCHWLILDRLQV